MSYFRPKPRSLHHCSGRPCPACDWCDEWDRSVRIAQVGWLIQLVFLGAWLASEAIR